MKPLSSLKQWEKNGIKYVKVITGLTKRKWHFVTDAKSSKIVAVKKIKFGNTYVFSLK